jgi:ADP-ribosylglycohydrolase
VAFTVLGWLYGRDFGDAICTAVNCGDDTDCTGATLGSLLGILGGTEAIPARWSDPIGRQIKTVAISGFDNVSNLDDLTDQTVAMAKRVADERGLPVSIGPGATDSSKASKLKLIDISAAKRLWNLSPYRVVWREKGLEATLDYGGPPTMEPGKRRAIGVGVVGETGAPVDATCSIVKLPAKWRCNVKAGAKPGIFRVEIEAPEIVPEHTLFEAVVTAGERSVAIPVALFSENP